MRRSPGTPSWRTVWPNVWVSLGGPLSRMARLCIGNKRQRAKKSNCSRNSRSRLIGLRRPGQHIASISRDGFLKPHGSPRTDVRAGALCQNRTIKSTRHHCHCRAFMRWATPLVVVVTHCTAQLDWLNDFTRVADAVVYSRCSPCKNRSDFMCVDMPRPGHDSHSVAHFLFEHYYSLPAVTLFLQDDYRQNHQRTADFLLSYNRSELHAWSENVRHARFGDVTSECACSHESEDFFRPCPTTMPPWPQDTTRCYGDAWHAIVWIREVLLGEKHARQEHTLRWAGACTFAVSRKHVHRVPRSTYGVLASLLDGTLQLHTPAVNKEWSTVEMSNAVERPWSYVFT